MCVLQHKCILVQGAYILITHVFRNIIICSLHIIRSKTKVQIVVHRVSGNYFILIDDIVIPKTWLSAYCITVLMVTNVFLIVNIHSASVQRCLCPVMGFTYLPGRLMLTQLQTKCHLEQGTLTCIQPPLV